MYTYNDCLEQSYFYNLALDTFEVLILNCWTYICNWYYGAYVIIYDFSRAIISPPWIKGRDHSLSNVRRWWNLTDTNTVREIRRGSSREGGRGKFALEATGSALRRRKEWLRGRLARGHTAPPIYPFAPPVIHRTEKPINCIPRRRYFKRNGPLFSASRDVDRCVRLIEALYISEALTIR